MNYRNRNIIELEYRNRIWNSMSSIDKANQVKIAQPNRRNTKRKVGRTRKENVTTFRIKVYCKIILPN